jgi:hypothetical protein
MMSISTLILGIIWLVLGLIGLLWAECAFGNIRLKDLRSAPAEKTLFIKHTSGVLAALILGPALALYLRMIMPHIRNKQ